MFTKLYACVKNRGWRNGEFLCGCKMVRGYHKYQDTWIATGGERLKCAHEIENCSDLFAVAVYFDLHSLVH